MLASSTASRQRRIRTDIERALKFLVRGNRSVSYRSRTVNQRFTPASAELEGRCIASRFEAVQTENIFNLAQSFTTTACTSKTAEPGSAESTMETSLPRGFTAQQCTPAESVTRKTTVHRRILSNHGIAAKNRSKYPWKVAKSPTAVDSNFACAASFAALRSSIA